MDDIVTEHAGSILRIQLNRPEKLNAMTSAMYLALAGIFDEAANDENTRVVLWHGAGDSSARATISTISSRTLQGQANRRRPVS